MKNVNQSVIIRKPETGGITILVVLLLLVLLTVSAFGLSRNAIRETIISGTAREGMEVRDVADAGLNWGVFWLDDANVATTSLTGATAFQKQANNLLVNPNLFGSYQHIPAAANTDMYLNTVGDTQYFDMRLMCSGKLPVLFTSQNVIAVNTPSEALLPDLWSVRADANYVMGGVVTFQHSKEAWISTKARTVNQ